VTASPPAIARVLPSKLIPVMMPLVAASPLVSESSAQTLHSPQEPKQHLCRGLELAQVLVFPGSRTGSRLRCLGDARPRLKVVPPRSISLGPTAPA
jgi:hypothetical protein